MKFKCYKKFLKLVKFKCIQLIEIPAIAQVKKKNLKSCVLCEISCPASHASARLLAFRLTQLLPKLLIKVYSFEKVTLLTFFLINYLQLLLTGYGLLGFLFSSHTRSADMVHKFLFLTGWRKYTEKRHIKAFHHVEFRSKFSITPTSM